MRHVYGEMEMSGHDCARQPGGSNVHTDVDAWILIQRLTTRHASTRPRQLTGAQGRLDMIQRLTSERVGAGRTKPGGEREGRS